MYDISYLSISFIFYIPYIPIAYIYIYVFFLLHNFVYTYPPLGLFSNAEKTWPLSPRSSGDFNQITLRWKWWKPMLFEPWSIKNVSWHCFYTGDSVTRVHGGGWLAVGCTSSTELPTWVFFPRELDIIPTKEKPTKNVAPRILFREHQLNTVGPTRTLIRGTSNCLGWKSLKTTWEGINPMTDSHGYG